jgi:hypothetical protein
MIEILVLWILGLIAIAIAWKDTNGAAVSVKSRVRSFAQLVQVPRQSKYLEMVVGSLLAITVLSIMVLAGNTHVAERDGLPTLFVWAGGLWLVPFRFNAVGHYGLSFVVSAMILGGFLVWSMDFPSLRMHAKRAISAQQGRDTSAGVTGFAFLFWIFLIGLTFAAITHYTSGTTLAPSS